MRVSRRVFFGAALAAAVALALGAPDAGAYTAYTQSQDSGNCFTCHGDFRANPYLRLGVDQGWATDLMDGHMDVISDCNVCHTAGGFYPTSTFSSGDATFDTSCLGCHGRFEDALGSVESSGLRQHHWDAGITLCGGCHPLDSDPGVYTPVGEDVLPPNYDVNLSVVSQTDPCNPGGAGEDFAGDSAGLDNDGDSAYDELDSDCALPTPTPTPVPPTPTPVPPTPTATPVPPTPTAPPEPTPTAPPEPTPTAPPEPTPTAPPEPTPTAPPEPTPTAPPEPTPTAPPEPTPTAPPEPTPTAVPPTPTPPPPSGKVAVCHKGKKTLVIGAPAVPAHLRHGDTLGECSDPASGRVVMCKIKRGKPVNVLVSQKRVSKKLAKGLTLGECASR